MKWTIQALVMFTFLLGMAAMMPSQAAAQTLTFPTLDLTLYGGTGSTNPFGSLLGGTGSTNPFGSLYGGTDFTNPFGSLFGGTDFTNLFGGTDFTNLFGSLFGGTTNPYSNLFIGFGGTNNLFAGLFGTLFPGGTSPAG